MDSLVVDEAFRRRIQSLRVADLHSLLRALGCSYQANKDILVKRVISKYADLYDQYREGIIGSQTVKMHTEILNRHAPLPPKPQSYATTSHSNFPTSKNNVKPPVSLDSKKDIARVTTPAQNVITMSIDSGNIAIPKSVDPFLESDITLEWMRLKPMLETRFKPNQLTFNISPQKYADVKSGAFRVIIRCFEIKGNTVAGTHVWPTECTVKVNGSPINLGIKKQQPQQKKPVHPTPDKPAEISVYCKNGKNLIEVTMGVSGTHGQSYVMAVDVMKVISVDFLLDIVKKQRTVDYTNAKNMVISSFGGKDEIQELQTTLSLLCPLVRTRNSLPGRAYTCKHIQCFDLNNYLLLNQRNPTWRCPLCSSTALYSNLFIDSYFTDLLKNVGDDVSEVHVDPEGVWSLPTKPTKSTNKSTISPPSSPQSLSASPVTVTSVTAPRLPAPAVAKPSPAAGKPVFIDLCDSDEEDSRPVQPSSAKKRRTEEESPVLPTLPPLPPPQQPSPYSFSTTSSGSSPSPHQLQFPPASFPIIGSLVVPSHITNGVQHSMLDLNREAPPNDMPPYDVTLPPSITSPPAVLHYLETQNPFNNFAVELPTPYADPIPQQQPTTTTTNPFNTSGDKIVPLNLNLNAPLSDSSFGSEPTTGDLNNNNNTTTTTTTTTTQSSRDYNWDRNLSADFDSYLDFSHVIPTAPTTTFSTTLPPSLASSASILTSLGDINNSHTNNNHNPPVVVDLATIVPTTTTATTTSTTSSSNGKLNGTPNLSSSNNNNNRTSNNSNSSSNNNSSNSNNNNNNNTFSKNYNVLSISGRPPVIILDSSDEEEDDESYYNYTNDRDEDEW